MKFLCFSVYVLMCSGISAQADYAPGYILNVKGDTVKGEIKVNHKNEMEVYSKVAFREKNPGAVRQMLPAKIHGFSFDGLEYASVRLDNQWVFMQVICRGKIMFYEYKPPVALGNERMQSQYFLMKGGFEEMDQFFVDSKAKKHLKDYISDDKTLLKDIEALSMDYSGLVQTINKYNERNK
ncbi:MAG: hypothetical protein ACJ76F_06880 [Bacteroidia bacterium]